MDLPFRSRSFTPFFCRIQNVPLVSFIEPTLDRAGLISLFPFLSLAAILVNNAFAWGRNLMKRMACVLGSLSILLVLSACTNPLLEDTASTGYVHIVIAPSEAPAQAVTAKAIPESADKLRFRIWHQQTGYNHVSTVALLPEGQSLAIEIPAGDNYILDVVSYQDGVYPVALTGDRVTGLDIAADDVTDVNLVLQAWDVAILGDDTVAKEAEYTLTFQPEDGGGVLTNDTFGTATLRASVVDFNTPATPLPAIADQAVHSQPGEVTLTGEAPAVDEETTLYIAVLLQFTQDWYDYEVADVAERSMFLELPNRHMGEDLHEITVEPSFGGIEINISSVDPTAP